MWGSVGKSVNLFFLLLLSNTCILYRAFRSATMWNRQNVAVFDWVVVGVGMFLLPIEEPTYGQSMYGGL